MILGQPQWDEPKIRSFFVTEDANAILNIPIINDHRDTTIWMNNDCGLYSVRSGYLFLQKPRGPLNRPTRIWKTISKLPALPKVRTFGWRLGHDVLPTGSM